MIIKEAVALRPIRVAEKNNRYIYYEATTFPNNPAAGCDMYLRRLKALGYLSKDRHSPVAVDILDANSDILDTINISKQGFEYLRRQFHFRVIKQDGNTESV